MLRDPEEDDRRDTQIGNLADGLAEPVERQLILTRHRPDLTEEVRAVINEHRVDQIIRRGGAQSQRPRREGGDGRGGVVGDEAG